MSDQFQAANERSALMRAGYLPIPVMHKGKRPVLDNWTAFNLIDDTHIDGWRRDHPSATNSGLLTRKNPTADSDILDPEIAAQIKAMIIVHIGASGAVLTRFGRAPKFAVPFRLVGEPFRKIMTPIFEDPDRGPGPSGKDNKYRIEILSDGQQFVACGVHEDTDVSYTWEPIAIQLVPSERLPPLDLGGAQAIIEKATSILRAVPRLREFGADKPKPTISERAAATVRAPIEITDRDVTYGAAALRNAAEEVASTPNGTRNDVLNAKAYTLGRQVAAGRLEPQDIEEALYDAAKQNGLTTDKNDGPRSVRATIASGLKKGMQRPAEPLAERETEYRSSGDPGADTADPADDADDEPIAAPAFSDEALALRFADQHAPHMRYVAKWGTWLMFDGTRWAFDETLKARGIARQICRDAANSCNDKEKTKANIASRKTIAAVEALAMADRRVAATTEQWDIDPWALNTPAGEVDLQTGELRPHEATDYMTKVTAVAPDPKCATPTWYSFLSRITDGDSALISFLQRVAGYGLTGRTDEHALFFKFGYGANGKTTYINTVTGIMGDYARPAPIETFTASSNSDRHPTELAGLRGARVVSSVETEEGRRWAESKIKALTGGDKISARFMRQDFFDFTPQFKLVIAGNHKRFYLIPFTITIPKEERDRDLSKKLETEWPGILQWMIDGCLEWQRRGLAAPEKVMAATAEYLEAQDAIAAWIEDCADRQSDWFEPDAALWGSWTQWTEKTGEYQGKRKDFISRLENRPGMIDVGAINLAGSLG